MLVCVLLSFGGTLASYCTDLCLERNCTCTLFYLPSNFNINDSWIDIPSAQNISVIIIVFHLITISMSFVHREYSIWQRSPHKNFLWLAIVIALLILQLIFTILSFNQAAKDYENYIGFQIANFVIVFAVLSPLLTFIVNEMVKKQEIKANLRYQRRARLDFGTKLGMNSPF
ncbi:hypothetical protein ILUMI_27093 [Ignelater luminosus]|uniref:Calcium-transporting ATPase n=1 Tax=Ignelater luminosus TaxID=2038154 RepID=A0A8K0C3U0_IGNLU|nr:hypothetical protein ILUMI_27093 [Ignelater luminosus]